MATRTAGQLASMIKQMVTMDLAEIGESTSQQNSFIFDAMSRALKELAGISDNRKESDRLNITSDGYVTFQQDSSDVTDLYQPLMILDVRGAEVRKRTRFTQPMGWFRESHTSPIHVKGLTGDYTLHYIAYPAEITSESDVPEFPPAGYMALCFWTCGVIKESKNFYEEAAVMYEKAKERYPILIKATEDARG